MSTYLSGISDYIPTLQPFQPDLNFMGNVLQTKQSRYDQANKQIGKFYGNLLYSPMLREENITKRDEFFKTVDNEVKKLSGLDLSLQQNQDYAMQIFKPFYEDKDIIKDMRWTKNFYSQKERAEGFRNCIDPKECGGSYWAEGDTYLDYKAQDFKNASREEALSFDDAYFTPDPMVADKAFAKIKADGLEIKMDSLSGGYIVTTTNGKEMLGTLQSYLQSTMSHELGVQEYYNQRAYLAKKSYINTEGLKVGPEQAASNYQTIVFSQATNQLDKNHKDAVKQADGTEALKKTYEDYIRKHGVLENESDIIDGFLSLNKQHQLAQQRKDFSDQNMSLIKNTTMNFQNRKILDANTDNIVARALMNKDFGDIAKIYQQGTFKQEFKPDAFALQKNAFDLEIAKMPFQMQKEIEVYRQKKIMDKEYEQTEAVDALGSMVFRPDLAGTATGPDYPVMAGDDNAKLNEDLGYRVDSGINNYLTTMVNSMSSSYQSSSATAAQQTALETTAADIFKSSGLDPAKLLQGDKAELARLNQLHPKMKEVTYSRAQGFTDPNQRPELSFWNNSFYNNSIETRMDIRKNQLGKSIYQKEMQASSGRILEDLKTEYSKEDPIKALLAESMLNSVDGTFMPKIKNDYDKGVQAQLFMAKYGDKIDGDWNSIKEYVMENIDDVSEDWNQKYNSGEYAQSYRHALGGKQSNAIVGGGYQGDFDLNYSHENNRTLASLINNVKQYPSDIKATYANGEPADEVAQAFLSDFKTPRKGKDSKTMGRFTVAGVSESDPGFMEFTVYLEETWAKQYFGAKDSPGITRDQLYKEGIKFRIPADKAQNQYSEQSKVDEWDYILEKQGQIKVDEIPSGDLTLTKTGNSYHVSGEVRSAKTDGTYSILDIDRTFQAQSLDAGDLYDNWTRVLMSLQLQNQQVLAGARAENGIKDPNKLLELLIPQ